jgi:hypothetical protein
MLLGHSLYPPDSFLIIFPTSFQTSNEGRFLAVIFTAEITSRKKPPKTPLVIDIVNELLETNSLLFKERNISCLK